MPTDLPRALSFTQPWLFAILECGKRIENRTNKRGMPPMCRYRGPLLLHAAAGIVSRLDFEATRQEIRRLSGRCAPTLSYIARGGIVGRCRVVGHVEPSFGGLAKVVDTSVTETMLRWWQWGYALVLADVEPLPFVACRGALGLWRPTAGVLAACGYAVPPLPPRLSLPSS